MKDPDSDFNRIVIKQYRKCLPLGECGSHVLGWRVCDELQKKGIEVVDVPDKGDPSFKDVWEWNEYITKLGEDYYSGKRQPRNPKTNKGINPWQELGTWMLKELREKGWDLRTG